jgi:hypothetical protein
MSATSELRSAAWIERNVWDSETCRKLAPDDTAIHLAVADWLEEHIEDHSSYDCDTDGPCAGVRLARAINGGAS